MASGKGQRRNQEDMEKHLTTWDETHFLKHALDMVFEMDGSCSSSSSSSSESSTDSEEDDQELECVNMVVGICKEQGKQTRKRKVPLRDALTWFSYIDFKADFHISQSTFALLLDDLHASNVLSGQESSHGGRVKLGHEKYLMVALSYLTTQDSMRSISNRFGVAQCSVLGSVRRIIEWLSSRANHHIRWPNGEVLARQLSVEFKAKAGVPSVLGAVATMPIRIRKLHNTELHADGDGKHAMILQAVCDSRGCFINVSCGEPASLSNAAVLRRSKLYSEAMTNKAKVFPSGTCLLGDASYPPLEWMVPPFVKVSGRLLTEDQERFNGFHASTRIVVDRALIRLKKRFPRLGYIDMNVLTHINKVVLSCCVLHNICLQNKDNYADDSGGLQKGHVPNVPFGIVPRPETVGDECEDKRLEICDLTLK